MDMFSFDIFIKMFVAHPHFHIFNEYQAFLVVSALGYRDFKPKPLSFAIQ